MDTNKGQVAPDNRTPGLNLASARFKRLRTRDLMRQPIPEWDAVVARVRMSDDYRRHLQSLSADDAAPPLIVAANPTDNDTAPSLVFGRPALVAAHDLDIERVQVLLVDKEDIPAVQLWLNRIASRPKDDRDEWPGDLWDDD